MKITNISFLYITVVLFICSGLLKGQTNDSIKTQKLSDIEITGSSSKAALPYLSTGATYVLDNDYFLKQGIQSLADAIRKFNGAVLKDYGGIGGIKTVVVRGMGAEHTAILYDGIFVSNAQSGQVDVGRFPLDNIQYVSLNIGQSDDIFQPARTYTSSGILNLKTIHPGFEDKNHQGYIKLTGGSWGLFNPIIDYAQKVNNTMSVSANVNWQRSDGNYSFIQSDGWTGHKKKRHNSDTDIFRSEINIYNNWGHKGELESKIYYYDSERGLPGAAILYKEYAGERLWDRNLAFQSVYTRSIQNNLQIKALAKYSNAYMRYENIDAVGKAIDTYREQEAYIGGVIKYDLNRGISTSIAQDLVYNKLKTSFTAFGSNPPLPERYNSFTAIAGHYSTQRILANIGLLATYASERLHNDFLPDKTYRRLSPSAGISYQLFEDHKLRIRISYKEGFRIASFSELYYTSVQKELNPERSQQLNLGITWLKEFRNSAINYISLSGDSYYNRVKDKIVIIPTTFVPRTLNLGRVDMKGMDIKLVTNLRLSSKVNIDLMGTYSYMEAKDKTDSSQDGYNKQIAYIPKHTINSSIEIKNPWLNLTYSIFYNNRRYTQSSNQVSVDNQIEGYSDHSIAVYKSLEISKNILYIQGNINNVWNKNYEVIKNYPMPRRSYKLSVGYKF